MYYRHRRRAVPDNRVTSEPIAVLFVLQEEDEEEMEEKERGRERKHTTSNRRWGINATAAAKQ